jgi:FkbM family methyltransferase
MNFSGISNRTLPGKLLRLPLRFIPAEMKLPIMQGRLKGKKWIVGSSDHGCWIGSYEYEKRLLFEKMVRPGSVVFDIGAHVGFYTLLASTLVGPLGKVFAFEPVPENLCFLKEHLRLNRVINVAVIEKAVSDRSGVAAFADGPSRAMGHLAAQGRRQVPTVSLDELVAAGEIPLPDYIKIDVENADWLVLSGARSLLECAHPVIFLATDIYVSQQQSFQLLTSLGYQLQPIDGKSLEQSQEVLAIYQGSNG